MTDFCGAILSADKIGRLCRSSDIPLSNLRLNSAVDAITVNKKYSKQTRRDAIKKQVTYSSPVAWWKLVRIVLVEQIVPH